MEIEEKLNQSKTLSGTGMMGFYTKMLDNKLGDTNNDIREKAKEAVVSKTNIDQILEHNEKLREIEQKKKDEVKKQT